MSKILTISFLFALVFLSSAMTSLKKFHNKHKTSSASVVGCQSYFLKSQTGIDTPIRISNTGDIMCLSHDGANCAWSAVYSSTDCLKYFNAGAVKPLVCGAAHQALYGITGYDDPNHWCYQGRNYFKRWHCSDEGTNIGTGVSVNPSNNNIQCLAFDGANCVWNDFNSCSNNRANPASNINPLVCGQAHVNLYGQPNPYFSSGAHWCKTGLAFFYADNVWHCGGDLGLGEDVPFTLNANGDVQCFALDGKNCAWGYGTGANCVNYVKSNLNKVAPLVCGDAHKALYGSDGYTQSGHWCNVFMSSYYLKGRGA